MSEAFLVKVLEDPQAADALLFTFTPRPMLSDIGSPLPHVLRVRGAALEWSTPAPEASDARTEFEQAVRARLEARASWIGRMTALVDEVERLARQLGWATRRIEKRLQDSYIGKHSVPALLMQEETIRILLEPIGRATSGAEGIADLYLMPAYDDIAHFYYYDGRWNLHYQSPTANGVVPDRESSRRPLNLDTLQNVLAELKQHAS